jgi:hypothetical protein
MTDRWHVVLQTLKARFDAEARTEELAEFLSREGFDRRQSGEIVARFRAETGRRALLSNPTPGQPPLRVLGPHEWGRFTPEAWGRLLALSAGGLLSPHDFERLIDRALEQGDGRVDLAAVRAILEGIGLADPAGDTAPLTIH